MPMSGKEPTAMNEAPAQPVVIARVCDDFRSDLEGLPVIRLHGDAHVEKFA